MPPSLAPLLLCPSPISQTGNTALMLAAREGKEGCLKLLLEAGCDTDAKNKVRDECGVVVMTREIVVLSCNGWDGGTAIRRVMGVGGWGAGLGGGVVGVVVV